MLNFISLSQFMSYRGYTFFLVCFYIMVAGLFFNVILCLYVGNSFRNSRFDHVWPIVLLRYYSLIFFQLLEVASISFFLIALDCQYWNTDHLGYNQEYPEVAW